MARENRWPWVRYRFHANYEDWRPVTFPPPGPYWCSGSAGDDSYAIIVAFLPHGVKLKDYWPEANTIQRTRTTRVIFTVRFPKPDWWIGDTGYPPDEDHLSATPDGWQSIATAPKDGTPIIAYQPGGVYGNGIAFPASVGTAYWRKADGFNPPHWSGPYNPRDYPTHWMPFPEPPV